MNERRPSMVPALAAAAALHAALLWALIFMNQSQFLPTGTAVPINIVASGPTTDSRPAEAAPVAQEAQAETPVPEAKPPAPPPAPKVESAPPKPAPKPTPPAKPVPIATRPATVPAKPAPAKDTFSLDALQASIARAARSQPARPAMAKRGPTRAETAPVARVDAGSGVSQSDIAGLSQLLQRLWNPDCSVDGPDRIVIPVRFTVGDDGRLIGGVSAGGRESSSDREVFAAARRAIDAAHQAAPYGAPYRGKSFTVNFDAEKACAQR